MDAYIEWLPGEIRRIVERDGTIEVWGRLCEWFAGCDNVSTHLEPNPVLGLVPACDRCPTIGRT